MRSTLPTDSLHTNHLHGRMHGRLLGVCAALTLGGACADGREEALGAAPEAVASETAALAKGPTCKTFGRVNGQRVRRAWSTLCATDRQRFVDAVAKLKKKAPSWSYESYCAGTAGAYAANAYDYFVEAHMHAFVERGMSGDDTMPDMPGMDMEMDTGEGEALDRPHMGPQFLPWHRELLRRFESEVASAMGNADFALPYWDWTTPAGALFSSADIGTRGVCPSGSVSGRLTTAGFRVNIYTSPASPQPEDVFSRDSIYCMADPQVPPLKRRSAVVQRGAGCNPFAPTPPAAADVEHIFDLPTYDVDPFDSTVDEEASMRQNLEGYTDTDTNPICVTGGCRMHGRGHLYVGGELASGAGTPNDPVFFLHHANVDRIWGEWQDTFGDATYPSAYLGTLFWFTDVEARDVLDERALGYVYDTQL